MHWYGSEVPFNFLGSVLFHTSVWRSIRVVFLKLFVLIQFHLIVLMLFHWVRQVWRNTFIFRRIVVPSLFSWVRWFLFLFWSLFGFSGILVLQVSLVCLCCWFTGFVSFSCWNVCFLCSPTCWYRQIYICSSSLMQYLKISFCSIIQQLIHSFPWVHISGKLNLPCFCI